MISKKFFYGVNLALISSFSCAIVIAQENCNLQYSQAYESCMNNAGATPELINCINAEYEYQDALLNSAYQKLMRNFTPQRQKTLKQAQKAWIKFREANCEAHYDPEGGSIASVNAHECSMRMTAERVKELDNFDMSY